MMNVNEICQIMDKAKETGVQEFEYDGVKIQFSHDKIFMKAPEFGQKPMKNPLQSASSEQSIRALEQAFLQNQAHVESFASQPTFKAPVPDAKIEDLLKPMSTLDQLSPEEILYAATPYFDQLQAQKAEHQKKLDEDLNK